MDKVIENISLKRSNRYMKKLELLKKNEKKIQTSSISIQTDEISYKQKKNNKDKNIKKIQTIDIETQTENYENIYKNKYYSLLLNLKNVKFSNNSDNNYTIGKIHKLGNELNLNFSIMNNSEIIFFDNDEITYKITIDRESITFNYLKNNIIKKIKKDYVLDFLLIKDKKNIFSKINNITILIIKGNLDYYFIKKNF